MGRKVAAIYDIADHYTMPADQDCDHFVSHLILSANKKLGNWDLKKPANRPIVTRGLGGTSKKAIKYCRENNYDFYNIDTGYIQRTSRKDYHRITKNAMQNLGPLVERDHDRLRKLKWQYRQHTPGNKILVVPPSTKAMNAHDESLDIWMETVLSQLKQNTSKEVVVRLKPTRTERTTNNTIYDAMNDAYCVVTHNSIAATEALLYGVPAIALAPNAATIFCNTSISEINNLYIPNLKDMTAFAAHLSYCQFTGDEIKNGTAWRILHESS